jgi:hypothetical protein
MHQSKVGVIAEIENSGRQSGKRLVEDGDLPV